MQTPSLNRPPVDFTIRLVPAAWHALRERIGADTDDKLADHLKLAQSTVTRTLNGTADVGVKFVAHTMHAFPFASFDRLFTIKARP